MQGRVGSNHPRIDILLPRETSCMSVLRPAGRLAAGPPAREFIPSFASGRTIGRRPSSHKAMVTSVPRWPLQQVYPAQGTWNFNNNILPLRARRRSLRFDRTSLAACGAVWSKYYRTSSPIGANKIAIDVRVAILRSYAQIGGRHEYDVVMNLANQFANTPARERLMEAANLVLEPVVGRAMREARHGVLLRPVEPASGASQDLLRPAETFTRTDSATLLRPHDSDTG